MRLETELVVYDTQQGSTQQQISLIRINPEADALTAHGQVPLESSSILNIQSTALLALSAIDALIVSL